jgi:hypothetical protein
MAGVPCYIRSMADRYLLGEKTYKSLWYQKNKVRILEKRKAYEKANRSKIQAYRNAKYKENPEPFKAMHKSWRDRNPDKIRAQRKKFAKTPAGRLKKVNDRHKRRAVIHGASHEDCKERIKFLKLLPFCYYCFNYTPEIQIDNYIPISRGGRHEPNNLRAACPSCNHRKTNKMPYEI